MKKICFIVLYICLLFQLNAKIIEEASFTSKILGHKVKYYVYVPENYSETNTKYPVIYLLHGLFIDQKEWTSPEKGNIDEVLNNAIKKEQLPPVICIIPFAHKTKYYYINSFDKKGRWEDMFYEELIPRAENKYRILKQKESRGIIGVSMGGYGALLHALKYPSMYAACAAFSPGIRTDQQIIELTQKEYDIRYGHPFGMNLNGESRITGYYKQYDILRIINNSKPEDIAKVKFYINCGDNDLFTIGCCLLHIEMVKRKVTHVYNMGSGEHDWTYWKQFELDGLAFVANNLKKK